MTAVFVFWLLLSHFIGDYLLQSSWMANEKTKAWWPAWAHGLSYGLPFAVLLLVTFGWNPFVLLSMAIIICTHVVIDHYRLAKQIGWLRNQIGPKSYRFPWREGKENAGFSKDTPAWLSNWLMFIADNTIHVVINFLAVFWLFTLL